MAEDGVKSEAPSGQQEEENGHDNGCEEGEAAAPNPPLSKRQMKKQLKQQKWEEERDLRK